MSRPFIICVDDERIVLDSLKGQLNSEFGNDYNIETAESGQEALELCRDLFQNGEEIPLIIVDYIMPGMKGDELLKWIRKLEPKMVSILLTGQATIEGVVGAVNQGSVFRFIAKPWESDYFFSIVTEALQYYYGERSCEDKVDNLKAINSELRQTLAKKTMELEQIRRFPKLQAAIDAPEESGRVESPGLYDLLLTIKSGIDTIHHQRANLREPENPSLDDNSTNEFYQLTSAVLGNLAETLNQNIKDYPTGSFDNRILKLVNEQMSSMSQHFYTNLLELTNRVTGIEREFARDIERIAAWDNEEIVILDSNEILFFTSKDSQTYVITKESPYNMRETLDHLEPRLCNKKFFRCHRSFIVNLKLIDKITPGFNNEKKFFSKFEGIKDWIFEGFKDGIFKDLKFGIPISRDKITELKRLLEIT